MEFIFFLYGLAFFLLGFAILMYPKKGSSFFLSRKLHWVGWFGILHGVNEWLDLFIMLDAAGLSSYLVVLRMITLPTSFVCLVYFGSEVISGQNSKCRICKFLTLSLLAVWAMVFLLGEHSALKWDIWSRYLLCFTGTTLTAIALWLHVPEIEITENFRLALNLKAAASAFIAYGILAGLVVHDADFFPASLLNYSLFASGLGIPVQVFRTICAAVIAYHLIRVLRIFEWETQQILFNTEYRLNTVVETAPVILFVTDQDKRLSFIKGKGLGTLGINSTDVVNRPITEVFSQIPRISETTQKVLTGEEFTSTLFIGDAYYEVFLGPFRDRRGEIKGITGVAVDVTQQKTAQADMDKYRYEMEKNKALAAIGTLGAEIAKDMINPLHEAKVAFLKALSGLRKTIGAEEIKSDIRQGINGVSSALNKLDGFCEKANLDKPAESHPLEIDDILHRVTAVFQETAQKMMVKMAIQGANILPVMRIPGRELEQIVYTMIQNIIKTVDGEHLHHLDIDYAIRKHCLCLGFSEYRSDAIERDVDNKSDQAAAVDAEAEQYNFEMSVLRGMTEAYGGTVSISPNSRGGLLHEIRIPVDE